MMTPNGFYIRPDGSYVHPLNLTNTDIVNMSMDDWGVIRNYLSFNMPKNDTTTLLPNHRESIEQTAREMSSGPSYDYNPFTRTGYYTQPERIISNHSHSAAEDAYVKAAAAVVKTHQQLKKHQEKAKTYEDYYWQYIDATDSVEAAEALKNMLDLVNLRQEPIKGSWVADRTTITITKVKWWDKPVKPQWARWLFIISPEIAYTIIHALTGWSIP